MCSFTYFHVLCCTLWCFGTLYHQLTNLCLLSHVCMSVCGVCVCVRVCGGMSGGRKHCNLAELPHYIKRCSNKEEVGNHTFKNKASCFKSHPASTYFQTTAEYIDTPVLMALSLKAASNKKTQSTVKSCHFHPRSVSNT